MNKLVGQLGLSQTCRFGVGGLKASIIIIMPICNVLLTHSRATLNNASKYPNRVIKCQLILVTVVTFIYVPMYRSKRSNFQRLHQFKVKRVLITCIVNHHVNQNTVFSNTERLRLHFYFLRCLR